MTILGRPVAAHHALSAEFDANRPVKLKGVVARLDWINPHSWVYIDVMEIVVEGYQAKNGSNIANGGNITLADGRKLFVGSSGTGAPYEEKK